METPSHIVQRQITTLGPSEMAWKLVPKDQFLETIVHPLGELGDDDFTELVANLNDDVVSCLLKKLWTEQDIPPEENGYEESLPLMRMIKRVLLIRVGLCSSGLRESQRMQLKQQLALISLILNPEGLAEVTGLPLE